MKISNSREKLWDLIVKSVFTNQIIEGSNKGHFYNQIIDGIYFRETAFGAKVLATEWKRTGDVRFKESAERAYSSSYALLQSTSLSNGIDEPQVTFRGVKPRKGSIPATVLLVFALKEAAELLDKNLDLNLSDLSLYLSTCQISPGKFYHDKVDLNINNKKFLHVVNTSSMALLYYTNIVGTEYTNFDQTSLLSNLISNICKTQRSDGFWPYMEPNFLQKLLFPHFLVLHNKTKQKFLSDKSIYFGDAVHHCITLDYLLKSVDFELGDTSSNLAKKAILKGWNFILKNLKKCSNNQIKFDFGWEPKPRQLRYCNFIDTSTYFYIMDIVNELMKAGFLSSDEASMYTSGICNYIIEQLVQDGSVISPYDGPDDVYNKIIPRPAESIYDKGYLMSNLMIRSN